MQTLNHYVVFTIAKTLKIKTNDVLPEHLVTMYHYENDTKEWVERLEVSMATLPIKQALLRNTELWLSGYEELISRFGLSKNKSYNKLFVADLVSDRMTSYILALLKANDVDHFNELIYGAPGSLENLWQMLFHKSSELTPESLQLINQHNAQIEQLKDKEI